MWSLPCFRTLAVSSTSRTSICGGIFSACGQGACSRISKPCHDGWKEGVCGVCLRLGNPQNDKVSFGFPPDHSKTGTLKQGHPPLPKWSPKPDPEKKRREKKTASSSEPSASPENRVFENNPVRTLVTRAEPGVKSQEVRELRNPRCVFFIGGGGVSEVKTKLICLREL